MIWYDIYIHAIVDFDHGDQTQQVRIDVAWYDMIWNDMIWYDFSRISKKQLQDKDLLKELIKKFSLQNIWYDINVFNAPVGLDLGDEARQLCMQ